MKNAGNLRLPAVIYSCTYRGRDISLPYVPSIGLLNRFGHYGELQLGLGQ